MTDSEKTDDLAECLYQLRQDGLVERHMVIPQGYKLDHLRNDERTRKCFALDIDIQNMLWIENQEPCSKCGARWYLNGQWAEIEHAGHIIPAPLENAS